MTPQMIVFDTEAELNDFLNSLGVPCQAEEPKKENQSCPRNAKMDAIVNHAHSSGKFTVDTAHARAVAAKSKLTGGSVNYYTVKVKGQPVECGDVIDALQLTFNEANIVKEIWRTANARLGNGKPGNTNLRGAEKIAYYANRIHEAEKQKA